VVRVGGCRPSPIEGYLADTSLVGESDFYRVTVERRRAREFFQAHSEAFLGRVDKT
jgi:hypothetical protein